MEMFLLKMSNFQRNMSSAAQNNLFFLVGYSPTILRKKTGTNRTASGRNHLRSRKLCVRILQRRRNERRRQRIVFERRKRRNAEFD